MSDRRESYDASLSGRASVSASFNLGLATILSVFAAHNSKLQIWLYCSVVILIHTYSSLQKSDDPGVDDYVHNLRSLVPWLSELLLCISIGRVVVEDAALPIPSTRPWYLVAALPVGFLRFREECFTFTSDLEIYCFISTCVMQTFRAAFQVSLALNRHQITRDTERNTVYILGFSCLILSQILISSFSYKVDCNTVLDTALQFYVIIMLKPVSLLFEFSSLNGPDFIPEDMGDLYKIIAGLERYEPDVVQPENVAVGQSQLTFLSGLKSITENRDQDQQTLSIHEPTHLCDDALTSCVQEQTPERDKPLSPVAQPPSGQNQQIVSTLMVLCSDLLDFAHEQTPETDETPPLTPTGGVLCSLEVHPLQEEQFEEN